MRANQQAPKDWKRTVAGLLMFLTVLLSSMGTMWLPAYIVECVLAADETVAEEMPLRERWPGRFRTPMEYRFEVDGGEYAGTPFLSEEAMVVNHDDNTAKGVVVRSLTRPAFHRLEPVLEAGGFPLVRLFPYWIAGCALLAFVVVALACHEHVVRFRHGRAHPVGDGGVIATNILTGVLLIVVPLTAFSSAQAFTGEYDFYAGLGWPLGILAMALLTVFLVAGIAGKMLEQIATQHEARLAAGAAAHRGDG